MGEVEASSRMHSPLMPPPVSPTVSSVMGVTRVWVAAQMLVMALLRTDITKRPSLLVMADVRPE